MSYAKRLRRIKNCSNQTAKQEWKECDSEANFCRQKKIDGHGHYLVTGGGSRILSARQIYYFPLFLPCHTQSAALLCPTQKNLSPVNFGRLPVEGTLA
jgi:hypothetical protein